MAHDHHHHHHRHTDQRALAVALAVIAAFFVAEVVGGIVAGSVALLSDAAHMLTDAGALGLALVAARLAARPESGAFTFGLRRAEILSAQVNGAALLVLAAVLGFESVRRLGAPADVDGAIVIAVGAAGAVANLVAARLLAGGESLNVRGARAHVIADLYGSAAAVGAGVVVVATDFDRADPIAALLVVALMLRSGWSLLRESSRVLLEGTPRGLDYQAIGNAMSRVPGVIEVHDLHVWEVTSGFPALSAHVLVAPDDDCHMRRRLVQAMLRADFGIDHSTLQVDHERGDQLLRIE